MYKIHVFGSIRHLGNRRMNKYACIKTTADPVVMFCASGILIFFPVILIIVAFKSHTLQISSSEMILQTSVVNPRAQHNAVFVSCCHASV